MINCDAAIEEYPQQFARTLVLTQLVSQPASGMSFHACAIVANTHLRIKKIVL